MKIAAFHRRRSQAGISLIEVMVSMVIGLVVVAAVIVSYLSSGTSGRQQSAFSTMTEDAQIAFSIMQREISMAGYSRPLGTTVSGGTTTFTKALSTRSIFGCDTGFTTPSAVSSTIACAVSGSPAIEAVYEADQYTAAGGKDCVGNDLNTLTWVAGGSATATLTYSRFYVANSASGRPELHCAASQRTGQPLVENVESMTVTYGLAGLIAGNDPRQVVRYVNASEVQAGPSWDKVISVRICLLMRSAEPVLTGEDNQSYTNCSRTLVTTSTDGYARRAYFSTIALRNRMGF